MTSTLKVSTPDHIVDTNEMVFTDDDVRDLRDDFVVPTMPKGCWQSHKKMRALLARLEAAEALAEWVYTWESPKQKSVLGRKLEAWRKAAGK